MGKLRSSDNNSSNNNNNNESESVSGSVVTNSLQPHGWGPPGSSYGILHARILEWVAISVSKGSSWIRDQTCISCIGRQILYHQASEKPTTFREASKAFEKEMPTHSSALAWKIPGTVEPGGLPYMGSHRIRHD